MKKKKRNVCNWQEAALFHALSWMLSQVQHWWSRMHVPGTFAMTPKAGTVKFHSSQGLMPSNLTQILCALSHIYIYIYYIISISLNHSKSKSCSTPQRQSSTSVLGMSRFSITKVNSLSSSFSSTWWLPLRARLRPWWFNPVPPWLVGGAIPIPLKKIRVRQLGWLFHSQE